MTEDRDIIRLVDDDGHTRPLADIEREVIAKAIARHHGRGRMTEAARALGIGRSTLYRHTMIGESPLVREL